MEEMSEPAEADDAPDSSGCSSSSSSSSRAGSGLSCSPGMGRPGRVGGLPSPMSPPGRLTSLKSRDLTLGGFKKPKKIFEPNVKAVRKSKDELREEVEEAAPKKEKRKRDERNREGRGGRRRERPRTIQSHSIFEQAPADTLHKTAWRSAPDLSDSAAPPACHLIKKERRDSEEDEDQILSKLQRDDFIDDPELRNDAKLRPIQLPLYQSSSFLKTETSPATGTCAGKEDPLLSYSADPPSSHPPTHGPPEGGGHQSREGSPSLGEFFQELSLSDQEELFFIQLPDCMPGRLSKSKGEAGAAGPMPERPSAKEGKAPDKRATPLKPQEAPARDSRVVLSNFSEGPLGKLLIRKSGRVQLKLGDMVMDVSKGTAFSFLQQLVSVSVADGQAGDMAVLGNVQHKLVFSPDFQALLQAVQSQGAPEQR